MTENTPPAGNRKLVAGIASGVLLTLLAIYLWQSDEPDPQPQAAPVQTSAPARFGPGVWTDPVPDTMSAVEMGTADTNAPGGLAVTTDKHLVISKALKDVADYFLLGGHPGTRPMHAEKLRAHLKASLPSPAFEEAVAIVQNYVAYLDAHDELLARDSIPAATPDSTLGEMEIERISAWLAQRARLRQDLLGMQVAQLWFGEEELLDQQMLASMRQHGKPPQTQLSPEQQASHGLQELREKNASYATQREYVQSHFGEQAAQRFDAIEGKEQLWKTRYANYRNGVENILRQPGTDAGERTRLIKSLREQTFATEQERLRAENLDALPPPRS